MLINHIFFILTLLFTHITLSTITLETDHTRWVPWTIEHTQSWEHYELLDKSPSQFRRNEYFEDMPTLIQRDTNWQIFSNLVHAHTETTPIFPSLGFAILEKENNELIGSLRFKLSSTKGYLSLSYGLKESVRHKKLGTEIAHLIFKLIDYYVGHPFISFKKNLCKGMFMQEWYEQGKLPNPNFNKLLDFFEKTPIKLHGLTASVDIINPASLVILYRQGMQPIEIECAKYYVHEGPNLFCFNITLAYPAITLGLNQEYINNLVLNILSRDQNRITLAENFLKNIFNVTPEWIYLSLNREEKANLRLVQSKLISSTFLSDITIQVKTIQRCEPPYCFIQ